MYSPVIYQILFIELKLSLAVHIVAACERRYTKEPLYEHRCVSGSEVVVHHVDRSRCQ